MNDRAYAGDVILMLGMLATFGLAGAAAAVLITLCRHSPIIIGGVIDLAEYTTGSRPALLNSPRVVALLPGAAPVMERPPREIADKAPRLTLPGGLPPAQSRPGRRPAATLTPDHVAADPLFRTLNEEPHRLVIGHTRGGKTTAMHAMVQSWAHQGQPVYVLDPDAARGSWPGAIEVAGYAEDYDGIGTVVEQLRTIFDERSERYAEGQRDFEPLHIVADEVHETIRNVPGARDFLFETVGRRGAKRGMLLTLGTQGNNVDELGLESAGVLNNFITAELERNERGQRRAMVYRGNAARKKRVQEFAVPALTPARDYVRPTPVTQAQQLPLPEDRPATRQLVRRAEEPAQVAARPATQPEPMPDLLAELLATMSPERAARLQAVTVQREQGDVIVNVNPVPITQRVKRREGGVDARARKLRAEKYRRIRELVASGKSANEIDRLLPGERQEILRIVREVKRDALSSAGGS